MYFRRTARTRKPLPCERTRGLVVAFDGFDERATGDRAANRCRKQKFLAHRFGVSSGWVFGRGGLVRLSEVRRVEVDIKERTNKRGGKGPTMRCNSDTGHKVMTSPTGQKPCRCRPLCVQSLVYKFIAHYHFIRQRYSLRVGSLLQSPFSSSSSTSSSSSYTLSRSHPPSRSALNSDDRNAI